MAIYYSIDEYTARKQGAAVALGFFDGVHRGHRAVISAACGELPCAALTFSESPAKMLGIPCPPQLTGNIRKAELLTAAGADDVIFADFAQMKDLSPEAFVRLILLEKLNAKRVVCGFNYRFGQHGAGDTAVLRELCAACGVGVTVCDPVFDGDDPVSSTRVRELLSAGEIARANALLGYCYRIEGDIGGGNHIGTTMGFPTVNIPLSEGTAAPKNGVYASRITIDGRRYRGATNIGVHPTVGASARPVCETFLIDFAGGSLYGRYAVCELIAFIREERRFSSLEELTGQIQKDCDRIRSMAVEI